MQAETARYAGLWRRLVLSLPGRPVDTLTEVGWLQGPGFYVDLRQPPAISAKVQASCLAELTPEEARLLARQEGFAGSFHLAGDEAEWARAVDYQPAGLLGDRGRLEDHGDLLVEHGIEADYIEHWQRDEAARPSRPRLPGHCRPARRYRSPGWRWKPPRAPARARSSRSKVRLPARSG